MKYILIILSLLINGYTKAQTPKVGDVLTNPDGSKGVVFWIQPDGSYGWMVSLFDADESKSFQWGMVNLDIPQLENCGEGTNTNARSWHAYQDTSGYQNTTRLRNYFRDTNVYACHKVDLTNGWYIPAAGQIRKLFSALPEIEEVIVDSGGQRLSSPFMYWTSTEYDKSNAWFFMANYGFLNIQGKQQKAKIRPICTFKIRGIEYDTTLTYQWNTGATTPFTEDTPVTTTEYTVKATNAGGCSITDSKKIFLSSPDPTDIYETLCQGETYTGNGFNETEPGTYTQTFKGNGGCDISLRLHLTVNKADTLEYHDAICQGETYTKNNFTAWKTGTYTQSWGRPGRCDSVVILHLSVLPAYNRLIYDTVCPGDSYTGHGFSISGIKYDSTATRIQQTASGCDSVTTLVLTVNPLNQKYLYKNICSGNDYTGNGFHLLQIQNDTIVSRRIPATTGCDTMAYLCITVMPRQDAFLHDRVCTGSSYNKQGFKVDRVTKDTVCVKTAQTAFGCDSVVTLQLTVLPSPVITLYDRICQGKSYIGHGFTTNRITKDTVCTKTVQTAFGCDSVVMLQLTVLPPPAITLYDQICQGKSYIGHGFTINRITKDTVCTKTVQTAFGCDSVITLYLTTWPSPMQEYHEQVCQNKPYSGYGFSIDRITKDTICMKTVQTIFGCDSVTILYLTKLPSSIKVFNEQICQGNNYTGHGFTVTSVAQDTTVVRHTLTPNGCDSTILLNLKVFPVYREFIEARICQGERYTEHAFDVSQPGTYEHIFNSIHGCDSSIVLTLQVADYFEGHISCLLEDCAEHSYSLSVSPPPAPDITYTYEWEFGDGTKAYTPEEYHNYPDSGFYKISLKVITERLCEQALHSTLYVPYYPEHIKILSDRNSIDDEYSRIKFYTIPLPGIKYDWDFGDGSGSSGEEAIHTYKIGGQLYYDVKLTGTNAEDCKTEDFMQVKVFRLSFEIPNTFSPNNDGVNDLFMPEYQVKIINRNGLLIYEGNQGWDGKYEGKDVPEDTYFYELRYQTSQKEKSKKGYITVAR